MIWDYFMVGVQLGAGVVGFLLAVAVVIAVLYGLAAAVLLAVVFTAEQIKKHRGRS